MQRVPTSPLELLAMLDNGVPPLVLARALLSRALEDGNGERSVRHCHIKGLDSVVLYDPPGEGMVRFYVAHAGKHRMDRLESHGGHFTVGVHNHRYRIAKIPLDNAIVNVRTWEVETPNHPGFPPISVIDAYRYGFESALRGGQMQTVMRGKTHLRAPQPDLLEPGDVSIMEPEDLHTVLASPRRTTSWMVVESPPVEDLDPLIYSPKPGLKLSKKGLYQPMSDEAVESAIRGALARSAG